METLTIVGIAAAAGAVILIGYTLSTYNKLIRSRLDAERQAGHVQVHLKKKFDMIPALVETVKGYAKHEGRTFEEVARLRSQWGQAKTPDQKVKSANMLESALSRLLIIQERYPRLKADRSFNSLLKSIRYVEQEIVHERKVYNKRVSWYNLRIQQFPSNIIAKMFGFEQKEFFSFEGKDGEE